MKLVVKFVIGCLALIGLLVVGINVIGPEKVFVGACSSTTLREAQSPSGSLIASIATRTCEDSTLHSGTFVGMRRTEQMDIKQMRIAYNTSTEFEITRVSDDVLEIVGSSDLVSVGETVGSLEDVWIRTRASR